LSDFKDMINIINGDNIEKSLASDASGVENSSEAINEQSLTIEKNSPQFNNNLIDENQKALSPFNVELFTKEVAKKSDNKGRAYAKLTQNISGYDIASKCIADVVFKLQNTPVKSFAMTYKYILENYLKEAQTANVKRRTQPPILEHYKIDTLQFIYVCHEILASDIEDFGQMLNNIKHIKKSLNSKSNSFFFMTALTVNLTDEISKPYIDFIHDKIKRINWYLSNNKQPTSDDPYVDTKKCFFCLYNDICHLK